MNLKILDDFARDEIQPNSTLVLKHLHALEEMVRIDSRSFSVNEFEGDRKTPSDMQEILNYANDYLQQIGFKKIIILPRSVSNPGSRQPLIGPNGSASWAITAKRWTNRSRLLRLAELWRRTRGRNN